MMEFGVSAYSFSVHADYAPLASSLPHHTSVHHEWPRENIRVDLPDYINIATTRTNTASRIEDENSLLTLMGTPIHVLEGDRLEISLENYLPTTGLSLHFHGFEMADSLVYDGVVGITQCAVSPNESFLYNFTVDEVPGTYWYHTHSGPLGIDSYNGIKGPLIVHPRNSSKYQTIVDSQNNNKMEKDSTKYFESLVSYENERILFFSDGFLMSDSHVQLFNMGGLNPPVSKNTDGFTVGSIRYDFGTCNGKLREIINVMPDEKYVFRLLNGGSHFAFRIRIDGIPMTIISADSEPVKPYEVDEVILHTAERFDVEITIPSDFKGGERLWIRADTLESEAQGYQNGVRAILNVVGPLSFLNAFDVPDPVENIVRQEVTNEKDTRTMNCYNRHERESRNDRKGSCLRITELEHFNEDTSALHDPSKLQDQLPTELSNVHKIDFQFSPPPMFAHFVRIDGGLSLQHENPSKAMLDPSFNFDIDVHPNTAILNVPSHSSVIIVWRTSSLMDHPIHLHGSKMEILAVEHPQRKRDCTLSECKLSAAFDSTDTLSALDTIPIGASVLKDTFILPAGGVVVTRIQTGKPALWYAHCHLDTHRDDGMAMILNVGNYQAPSNRSWLPDDYPSCDTPFLKTRHEHPACDCYIDNDAILGRTLTENHRCSRDHLCAHEQSQAANLDTYKESGFRISSKYTTPNWGISLIIMLVIAGGTFIVPIIVILFQRNISSKSVHESGSKHEHHYCCYDSTFQKMKTRVATDWKGYRPGCTNKLRVFEVTGLAVLTGYLFYDVGNDSTATGLSEKYSLLFFSITLWTFTRMYPAVANFNTWYKALEKNANSSISDTGIWCASRCIVIVGNEVWWPMIHCFVCYPMAGMFNQISLVTTMGIFLGLNTVCYVSIGAALGIVFDSVALGMSMSTIVSQTTMVAAGFYTHLPTSMSWIRYVSPVFWTYRGIVKTALRWTDTYSCFKGQSDVGSNECYLEFNPGIDALKRRGINVATFNDSQSDDVLLEFIVLCFLFIALQLFIFLSVSMKRRLRKEVTTLDDTDYL